MARIEFFFDCSSPWTYLAFHRIQPLARETGAEIAWRPMLVGGIFNSVNQSVYAAREKPVPAKAAYMRKDLGDWSRHCGLRIVFPPKIFPVNSVKIMRGCIVAAEEDKLVPFARAAFETYWGEDRDISQDDVIADICGRVGIAASPFLRAIAEPEVKERLKRNTDEAIARGAFGSPTIFVDGADMYFGNDRLELVAAAVRRGAKAG